jgi:hypothetical protein
MQAILDTLSERDWRYVRETTALINSYRDQIGTLYKRVTGVEPTWVEPTPSTRRTARCPAGITRSATKAARRRGAARTGSELHGHPREVVLHALHDGQRAHRTARRAHRHSAARGPGRHRRTSAASHSRSDAPRNVGRRRAGFSGAKKCRTRSIALRRPVLQRDQRRVPRSRGRHDAGAVLVSDDRAGAPPRVDGAARVELRDDGPPRHEHHERHGARRRHRRAQGDSRSGSAARRTPSSRRGGCPTTRR